jgi:hypothetical protein
MAQFCNSGLNNLRQNGRIAVFRYSEPPAQFLIYDLPECMKFPTVENSQPLRFRIESGEW